jgi:ribosomal protein S18 acetylase RimI-like enzyme
MAGFDRIRIDRTQIDRTHRRRHRLMTVTLRPESQQDEPFLRSLIYATIAGELGASQWPEPMRSHLLGVQYSARRQLHRANFPAAVSYVVDVDGADAGWAVVTPMPHEVQLVEIMILPELRGQGIGTATIREVLANAGAAGKPVRLNVNLTNHAAIGLYQRLGFRRIEGDEVQQLMECLPHS